MSDATRLARVPWCRVASRSIYANPWMRVREDNVLLPDGRTTIYGVVECAGAVGVPPFLDVDTVVLVGQYRYIAGAFLREMPTGGMHPGEIPEAAARRELGEEAGYEAERVVRLGAFDTSKSLLDEKAILYLAEGLRLWQGRRRGKPLGRGGP